jgi:putative transcriptional regulator
MTKKAFRGILAGLEDVLAFTKGDKSRAKIVAVTVADVDVRAARKKLGLSQDRFARAFGVSASTVRKWEQGQRRPTGAARVLVRVIERNPEAVRHALVGD